ncbi:MAG: TIGR03986 family CRISPR-associated RAMP protein [Gammaproteobacteria bacterium]|nr:MAG: TIGR03986 family CRISPR-associated RAMP protein [Gammaproteobacteria bacterium]
MSDTQKQAIHENKWHFRGIKRWEISAYLKTLSPLHIGDGGTIPVTIKDTQGKNREVEVNSVITGKAALPIIPGSTIKGRLRHYFSKHFSDKALLNKVFGEESDATDDDQGRGGLAEFHDAKWNPEKNRNLQGRYPYWNNTRKTYIEVSTAINRHTGAAKDKSLHHTECVPPGTVFEIKITGSMDDRCAALVVAALEAIQTTGSRIFLGAEDANGNGRIGLTGKITVKQMDQAHIIQWLQKDSTTCVASFSNVKAENETQVKQMVQRHIAPKLNSVVSAAGPSYDITLHFDGPFVVNDSDKCKAEDTPDIYPLEEKNGVPAFPVRSFRGAIRSQAERIIRTIGGQCCDGSINNTCKNPKNLCIACEMFGSTGWKTSIEMDPFLCVDRELKPFIIQEFVAIDRFHGGGKDEAKFNAAHYQAPVFKGKVRVSQRVGNDISWRKGLLALIFRDLKEGDIYFGFGTNKGYGAVKKAEINPDGNASDFSESDIEAFINKCREKKGLYNCNPIKKPGKTKVSKNLPPAIVPLDRTDSKFYNPYHFIPVKKPNTSSWAEKTAFGTADSPHSHGFYRKQTNEQQPLYSGRLICMLTSETPFFIGAQAESDPTENENQASLRHPYQLDGEPAIPSTSLRGLISTMTEAAANCAMRVLDSEIISYRKPMNPSHILSALGMVTKRGEDFWLIPLAMPALSLNDEEHNYKLDKRYRTMFPDGLAKLKVYLEKAYSNNVMKTFLNNENTWTLAQSKIHYLPLTPIQMQNGGINSYYNNLRTPSRSNNFLIGQTVAHGNGIPASGPGAGMVPGILRILGKEHRQNDLPQNKKHELFIPVPDAFVADPKTFLDTATAFLIPRNVIDAFEKIAEKQTQSQKQDKLKHDEERLPFHLKGTRREQNHTLQIKTGDLVYFRPNAKGDEVEEIAFSSIWRGKTSGTTADFFPDKELLPFNRNRSRVSPAELLFGFTENNPKEMKIDRGLAFAGKIRISAGTLSDKFSDTTESDLFEPETTLKALSSPKPPSPALYFKEKKSGTQYIKKQDLNPGKHEIQGRKIYLHALRNENNQNVQRITSQGKFDNAANRTQPWVSQNEERNHLKTKCKPLKSGLNFFFHIDFNNLTQWELGLLCYALRPCETFRHKIGMGKPIGLGTVKIDIAVLQTIDRYARYTDTTQDSERYNQGAWISQELQNEIPNQYKGKGISNKKGMLSPEDCRKVFMETMDADIQRAIELLGDPGNVTSPVHYPQLDRKNIETKNYEWFKQNEIEQQVLKPITKNTTHLTPFARWEQG